MHDPPQILIVDDNDIARSMLSILLRQEGYTLFFASSGSEALTVVEEKEPDAILLDIMMPGMNGLTVCQTLKEDKRWRHIPIILVTALNSDEDLAEGLDAGADEFLSKPVNGVELRARVRSILRIKQQYDDLTATLQLREDLTSMLVHDMRTPLTAILGFSELMLVKQTAPAEYTKDLQIIYTQSHRLNSFINDLLMLAKMERDQLLLNCTLAKMNKIIREVEKNHRLIAQLKGINLEIKLPDEDPPEKNLDVNLFQRVMDNLLSNAVKFSPTGTTVSIQVECPGKKPDSNLPESLIWIKFIDEGLGIAPEDRERIFDKFQIVKLNQEGVTQVGIGLAFCKLVIEAHGGRIFVEPNSPKGSIFIVEI